MSWALLLVLGLSVASAQDYSAEDQERAKVLFAQGQAFYEQGRYDEAVAALQLAYDLSGKPLLLFNMTAPLERLGRWEEALDALERFRPHAKEKDVEAIERRLVDLRAKVEEERAEADALAQAQQGPDRKGPPVGALAMFGVGAVALGTGTVFTVRALGARSDWTGMCAGDPGLCPTDAEPLVKRDKSSSVIADVSYVLGLGAVGGGVAITLGGKKSASDLSLVVSPTRVGLGGAF